MAVTPDGRRLHTLVGVGLSIAMAAATPVGALAALAAQAAQPVPSDWLQDPYTQGQKALLEQLGYRSLGPFSWGCTFGTDHVSRTLGAGSMLWVETRHFKLGCNLAPRLVDGETRHRRPITAELTRLARKLPLIDPRNRKLDRWLLLHLYAQRLEELYDSFCTHLGVDELDFPSNDGRRTPGVYMGRGPYLGQRGKFCVVLFDHRDQLKRYLTAFGGTRAAAPVPCRHPIADAGSLAFATASECFSSQLFGEMHMHSHLVGEVVKNLCDGYKSNLVDLPPWWVEGLSHWFRRRIDPRVNLLDADEDPAEAAWRAWDWPTKVRARVRHDYYPDAQTLLATKTTAGWLQQSHMMAWSRVDFLLTRDQHGMRRFLDALKDRPVPWRRVSRERFVAWQTAALDRGWGLDLDAFDAEWKQYVLSVYPK